MGVSMLLFCLIVIFYLYVFIVLYLYRIFVSYFSVGGLIGVCLWRVEVWRGNGGVVF